MVHIRDHAHGFNVMMDMPEKGKVTAVSVRLVFFHTSFSSCNFSFILLIVPLLLGQIADLTNDQLGRTEFRPKDLPAPLPNAEAAGSKPQSAKKRKAGTSSATSTGKRKKVETPSSKSTKQLEKEKAAKLKQTTLSFKKGDESSSALENIVMLDM